LNALLPSRVAAGMIYVIRFAIFVHFKTQGGQTGIMENNMSLTPVFQKTLTLLSAKIRRVHTALIDIKKC
jgi:hypothetical protein